MNRSIFNNTKDILQLISDWFYTPIVLVSLFIASLRSPKNIVKIPMIAESWRCTKPLRCSFPSLNF